MGDQVLSHIKQCWCCTGTGPLVDVPFLCRPPASYNEGGLSDLLTFSVMMIDSCSCDSCDGYDSDMENVGYPPGPYQPSNSMIFGYAN